MTYREKLQHDRPGCVNDCYLGGCAYCPGDHYQGAPGGREACGVVRPTDAVCRKCWDQEAREGERSLRSRLEGKVVYIAGPITGVERYWEAFETFEDALTGLGCSVLNPAKHPKGMTNAQYMRLSFAMIDTADAVLFLPCWEDSKGATLEHAYCEYVGKPFVSAEGPRWRQGTRILTVNLRKKLEEVLE